MFNWPIAVFVMLSLGPLFTLGKDGGTCFNAASENTTPQTELERFVAINRPSKKDEKGSGRKPYVEVTWLDHTSFESTEQTISGYVQFQQKDPAGIYHLFIGLDGEQPYDFTFSPDWSGELFELREFKVIDLTPVAVKTEVEMDEDFKKEFPFVGAEARARFYQWKALVETLGLKAVQDIPKKDDHVMLGVGVNPHLRAVRAGQQYRINYVQKADGTALVVIGIHAHKYNLINNVGNLAFTYEERSKVQVPLPRQ